MNQEMAAAELWQHSLEASVDPRWTSQRQSLFSSLYFHPFSWRSRVEDKQGVIGEGVKLGRGVGVEEAGSARSRECWVPWTISSCPEEGLPSSVS